MTAAGVQNIDSSAYVPPPPSTSSTDTRGTGAAGKSASTPSSANSQGEPSEFQSELASQQSGTQENESAGQTAPTKAGTGRPGKKRLAQQEDNNSSALTPVQVAAPQKQILPLALMFAQPQENAQPNEDTKPDEKATSEESGKTSGLAQEPAQAIGLAQLLPVAAGTPLPQPLQPEVTTQPEVTKQPQAGKQPAAVKSPAKVRQSVPVDALPIRTSKAAPSAMPDSSQAQIRPLASDRAGLPQPTPELPVHEVSAKSGDAALHEQTQDQVATSTNPAASSPSQPVSRVELNVPATPAEPAPSTVQEKPDSAPSSPSALAFAARLSTVSQQAVAPGTPDASPSANASAAASAQIPMRYPATAQILRNGTGTQQDGPKEDTSPSIEGAPRPAARTDMVLPRFETVSEAAPSSGSAAPQPAAPSTRAESELPAAPPTSSHDIRVRVPDNNGGTTQVRFVESGGEVRVSVRTADEGLAQNLRSHLNDLAQKLSDGGTPAAEIWKPVSTAASSQNDSHQPNQEGRGSGGQGSAGQGGQQDRQQKRPAWLEEMEASLHGEQN